MTTPATATQQPDRIAAIARVQSIDALRGLIMIIMALDHVRDFFHAGAMSFQPEDLSRTTAALFFTRWITHICAPVFAFTAGFGAFLWLSRGRTVPQLSRFLWTRGIWLVLLDITVVRFGMFLTLGPSAPVILNVLWMLGWSMVILGFIVRLPMVMVAAISVALIVGHNLADTVSAASFGHLSWIWNILHQPGVVLLDGIAVVIAYPLVPWFAVMAAGFCFGPVTMRNEARRRSILFRLGVVLTMAFFIIRALNVYGDPQPWSMQETPVQTAMSFLRASKYPPSLDFLLMTLGPAMLIWSWLDRKLLSSYNPLVVFGRVPLFYFVVHFYVIQALVFLFALGRYGTVSFLRNPLPSLGGPADQYPSGFGYELGAVYAVWILVVAIMYVPCLYFSRMKERKRHWLLSYL